MQAPPLPSTQKVSYQVPREVLTRVLWRRMMLRPRRLLFSGVILLVGISFFFIWPDDLFVGVIFLLFLVFMPVAQYRAIAKAIGNDRTWTDPKTLEFGSSRLLLAGSDWKSDMPWSAQVNDSVLGR